MSLATHRPVDEARIDDINDQVRIATEADQGKLDLLHKNLMKFGTIHNTIKSGAAVTGQVVRK